ncbi:hypothetical protein [Bradyrhizobium liaoningense]|uniref:hypothetical protein n=1 Tax=Bradyrhizobium liaoningense TaxID=43992 RepID=UPI00068708EF|nr:hypothetical protein [Bradyrhizobium liaoningense]
MAGQTDVGSGYRHNQQPRPQQQMDLFGSCLSNGAIGAPTWPEMPAEARAALTSLDATMLRWQLRRRRRSIMNSDKVRPHPMECEAILCVRQTSAHQVLHNHESSALQYAKQPADGTRVVRD